MKQITRTHLVLFAVFIGSLSIGMLFPMNEILRHISQLPALAALFIAIYNTIRDEAAHQKTRELQLEKQKHELNLQHQSELHAKELEHKRSLFDLGVTSHMAQVAFDKHALFCEDYIKEAHELLLTLSQNGPTEKMLDHTRNLYYVRQSYAAWTSESMLAALEPFESAARKIGALTFATKSAQGTNPEFHKSATQEAFDLFTQVLNIKSSPTTESGMEYLTVLKRIRAILGIEELVALRQSILTQASATIAPPA